MKTVQRVLAKIFLGDADKGNDLARAFPMLYSAFFCTSPVLSSRFSPTCRAMVRQASAIQAVNSAPATPDLALLPRVVGKTGHRSIAKRDVHPQATTMDSTAAVVAPAQARSTPKPQHMTKAEKRVAVDIVGRLKTAIDAKDACDVPAVGLLSLSVKCAAINVALGSNKCCPAGAERLRELLSPLLAMWKTAKFVIRNSKEWVSPEYQEEAFNLIGLHLADCHRALMPIKTAAGAAIFWPEVATSKRLQETTATFAALCQGKGETTTQQQQQQQQQQQVQGQLASSSSSSPYSPGKGRKNKAFFPCPPPHRLGSTSSGTGSGRTAAPSDDDDDGTLSPTSSSSSPSFFFKSSSHALAGSGNITVRQSSLSRWGESAKKEASTLAPTPTSVTTRSSSREGVVSLGRQRKHAPAKVSVSSGVMFVPYRSPTRRANPRGTSLRGSGAIAGR